MSNQLLKTSTDFSFYDILHSYSFKIKIKTANYNKPIDQVLLKIWVTELWPDLPTARSSVSIIKKN